jgi:uncharacterized protein YbjT (DUF2867 family)
MILVTGATGTNGREIVKQLSAKGAQVRTLVRNSSKAADLKKLGVEIVEGDFDKPETLDAALKGVEKALMLPPTDLRAVELQRNFIEAAKRAGTKHIVKFSAMGADPDSPMRIGRWHGETEKLLEASGIPFTHLRPNSFMQNMLSSAPTIASQGVFYQPGGDAPVSHVDVRDIVAVAVKTLTEEGHTGKIYTITGTEALTFDQVAEKLSAVIGKPVKYVNVSPEDFKKSLMNWGQPDWLADTLNELYEMYRNGWGDEVTDVVSTVAKKQPISFDQFFQDHIQAFTGS